MRLVHRSFYGQEQQFMDPDDPGDWRQAQIDLEAEDPFGYLEDNVAEAYHQFQV